MGPRDVILMPRSWAWTTSPLLFIFPFPCIAASRLGAWSDVAGSLVFSRRHDFALSSSNFFTPFFVGFVLPR
ncbi:hypothetical protein BDV19DRAFT_34695 [Aspergillus venezuelensis]